MWVGKTSLITDGRLYPGGCRCSVRNPREGSPGGGGGRDCGSRKGGGGGEGGRSTFHSSASRTGSRRGEWQEGLLIHGQLSIGRGFSFPRVIYSCSHTIFLFLLFPFFMGIGPGFAAGAGPVPLPHLGTRRTFPPRVWVIESALCFPFLLCLAADTCKSVTWLFFFPLFPTAYNLRAL